MEDIIMFETMLQRYKRDLAIKGYSKKTEDVYYRNIIYFFEYIQLQPEEVTRELVKDYLYYLSEERKLSSSSLRQARASIVYFYSQTLPMPMAISNIPVKKKETKMPTVFSVDEVFRILNSAANVKHKTMLMLIYSSGLRIGECIKLKVTDIRRDVMRVDVKEAKGGKFRSTILSSVCLRQLEEYWEIYRPVDWLFKGMKEGTHLTTRSIELAFNIAKENSKVKRYGTTHTLRHSFATHMLETGTSLYQLKNLLGHKSVNSTLVYLHINEEQNSVHSCLDIFKEKFYESETNC
jgi:integrase/recombinase XerD